MLLIDTMKEKINADIVEKKIFEAAKKIFVRDGFRRSSMSDIASEAGISRTSLNYYFRTKERLFIAIFKDILSEFFPNINTILDIKIPFEKKVDKIIDAHTAVLLANNRLPAFAAIQMNDSSDKFAPTIIDFIEKEGTLMRLKSILQAEYNLSGKRLRELLLLYMGLMVSPFVFRKILGDIAHEDFERLILSRKKFISKTVKNFLKKQ